MQFNTDFKLSGPLAGLFGGISQAQDQERQGLANAYQSLKNQEQQYTSAEAQAKMQDPQYIQMKLQNDMSKFGKETSLNEIESAYNKANRAVAHLKAAQAMGPEALQQAATSYLQEMKIDPNSEKGQMLLKDPVGSAEKLSQFYATAATNNSDYMQKYGLETKRGEENRQTEQVKGQFDLKKAGIAAGAQLTSADRYARGDMIKYSGQLTTEIQNYNTNIAKLEGKEMDAAIVQDFMQRNNGKQPTAQEIDAQKQTFKKKLETERDALIDERNTVRGQVGNKLGMKQGAGTEKEPIKLQ